MTIRFYALALLLSCAVSCSAEKRESTTQQPSALSEWMRNVGDKVDAALNGRKPRLVAKGAHPELVIGFDGSILFNGNEVRLGASFESWQKVLTPKAECREVDGLGSERLTICDWRSLGLTARGGEDKPGFINQLIIHVNFEQQEPWTPPDYSSRPKGLDTPFRGYLEIDGYGVDKDTKFWELRAKIDRRRDLRCGLTDCSHPHGGGNRHTINVRVDGRSEYDRLLRISLHHVEFTGTSEFER